MKFSYKKKLKIHNGWIKKVIFNSSEELVATCSTDTTIKILKKDILLKTITTHKLTVNDIKFSSTYPILVSASDDRRVLCHDLVTMKIFRNFYGNYSSVRCVDINDDIVVVGDRSTVMIYDIRSSNIVNTFSVGRVVNDVKILGRDILIGSHSLYVIGKNGNCTALCVNQNEIKEIKKTNGGVLLLSSERIVDLKMDDLHKLKYTEIKSDRESFSSAQFVDNNFFFTFGKKIMICDEFSNEMIDNTKCKLIGNVKENLNGICVNKNAEMLIACGESLHFFYRRDNETVLL